MPSDRLSIEGSLLVEGRGIWKRVETEKGGTEEDRKRGRWEEEAGQEHVVTKRECERGKRKNGRWRESWGTSNPLTHLAGTWWQVMM
jgi:hypothetical protein